MDWSSRERVREKHQRNQERWIRLLADAFSFSYYLPGNGGTPVRLDLRSQPEATVAVMSPRCPPVVHGRHRLHGRRPRAPPPLSVSPTDSLARAVAFVLLRALVSCVGLGNGWSEAGEGD